MGKIVFTTPVAADTEAENSQAAEQRLAMEKLPDLIERRHGLNRREEVTLLEAFRSLGYLDENVALEQQVISVHLAAYDAIEEFHNPHDEEPTDEQLKEMRVQAAQNMGAESVVTLLEHDPDRYQGFTNRFFEECHRKFEKGQSSKGGADD